MVTKEQLINAVSQMAEGTKVTINGILYKVQTSVIDGRKRLVPIPNWLK